MRYPSKHRHYSIAATKITTLCRHFRPLNHPNKRLSRLALLATVIVAPIHAQAALPEAIQKALARADLTEADISIVITPVGDKTASHLPAPIQVIDSGKPASQAASTTGSERATTNTATDISESNPNHQGALSTVEQRTIEKHEQKIHAYTDDPYTYQSVESVPTVIPDGSQHTLTHDANAQSTDKNAIKISFSPLLDHQSDIPRTPASTMKLVPSFIALDTLGADFVWHTRVYHTGLVIGDRLQGDLIIQGSGDPKMTHERLKQLLYKVQASGIRHIDGDIIIDSAVFNNVSKDPAAFDNSPLRPYNASPDGFLVNFSTIGIKTYPQDNGQASVTYKPRLANYQLPATINTRAASCGQASYSLAPQWQNTQLVLNASLPESCGEHVFYVAYPNAKEFAAHVIAAKWQALGNTLSGQVISQETPYDMTKTTKRAHGLTAIAMSPLPMVSYPSLNLTEQIHDINHFSNNVMAEQVALSIGAYDKERLTQSIPASTIATSPSSHKASASNEMDNKVAADKSNGKKADSLYQFGKPATTDYPAALQTINQWWQTNLSTPPPHLTNGSGLCRECTITAANLSELLTYAYSQPNFDAYVDSLGIAGVSGTIAAHSERLPESTATGRAWIKTGTLNNVTSMAGYVKGISGQDYVVVGIINTEQALNSYTARPVLDAMLDWTAQR
ncbi:MULTISPECIES: D-alanyl-D-alanine carboxypeptidase [unclassified Psychrobacter]|uniref:D-alanyl-D-alanine carboxypeptidase/D-alanyl-D-alanine-endopeptidase n=1 Tax=unclassified Psychrobacter TaxID=196806 RepID=UPI0025B42672|nr:MULTISPECIES: D-alanyl-D-alanine carboxypeptidase [unclassified Psychrobacter]MDN3453228.1 D-alanyl-D-alanine carboxypeptidase [Psychrobacter sp. APC 3350]MDN3502311.1 D-alanyl-D-alanine carboxypeptidase [Psychrobacter sp. 5A.1]